MKHVIALILVMALTGCLTATPQTLSKGEAPKANEGVVIANFECGKPLLLAHIYHSGKKLSMWTEPMLENVARMHCNQGYQTMIMPEGSYFISSLVTEPYQGKTVKVGNTEEANALKFSVKKGKTNYIGDLQLGIDIEHRLRNPKSKDLILVKTVRNDLMRAHVFMKATQPDLLAKYPIISAPAR